jgi:hypothetical protein
MPLASPGRSHDIRCVDVVNLCFLETEVLWLINMPEKRLQAWQALEQLSFEYPSHNRGSYLQAAMVHNDSLMPFVHCVEASMSNDELECARFWTQRTE